jgi:hypothetical protein
MAISTIGTNALGASAVALATQTSGVLPKASLPTGSVLQVVQGTYSTQATTTNTAMQDTGLTATITPQYATSKILVTAMNNVASTNSAGVYTSSYFQTVRGASTVLAYTRFQIGNSLAGGTNAITVGNITHTYLDSPATTSATTYKMQMASNEATITTTSAINGNTATIILMEIAG